MQAFSVFITGGSHILPISSDEYLKTITQGCKTKAVIGRLFKGAKRMWLINRLCGLKECEPGRHFSAECVSLQNRYIQENMQTF